MKQTDGHVPRFYVGEPLTVGTDVQLPAERAHHLHHVLRVRAGDPVILFNGYGGEHQGTLLELDKSRALVRLTAFCEAMRESPLRITLAQGIARGDRMDQAIAKATELGVAAVQPVHTERGKVRLQGTRLDKKQLHWQRIATSAAEQSARLRVPEVRPALPLAQFLQQAPDGVGLVLTPDTTQGLHDYEPMPAVTLLVGPESGFLDHEISSAQRAGYQPVRLGPRILRTETAGPAGLAALQALWGDWR